MPIYEYTCGACDHRFEHLHLRSAAESTVACPACGSDAVERAISAPAVSSTEQRRRSVAAEKKRRADRRTEVGASERDPTVDHHDDH